MSKGRTQSDGSIVYPARGPYPTLPGYTRSKGNPYVLEPDLIPCIHRTMTPILKPCGEFRCAYTCKIKEGREVNYLYCESCNDSEE